MFACAVCSCLAQSVRPPLGVYLGPGADGTARVPAFAQWFGRAPDRALDFFANDTWPSLESDAAWGCYSWCPPSSGAVVPQMTFSVPLTVNGTSLADVAAGLHDSSFLSVANSLVTYKWSGAVIRIGWEFNGSWMPWAAGADPASYVKAYRHVVALMRSVPGAHFTFDWCTSWGPAATAPDSVYPGDDVVDIIGMDIYNRYYSGADADPQHRWNTFLTAPYGLNWLVSFAHAHGKALSIPEWGTGEWLVGDGGIGGGDDPLFVGNMCQFIKANGATYSDYWDINASGYNASVSDYEHPLAGAALKAAFGLAIAVPGQVPWIGAGDLPTVSSVSVNFASPYEGGAVTDFVILYRPSGTSAWSPCVPVRVNGWQSITGLSAGTSYDVCVYAENSGGKGVASAIVTLTTLGAPTAAIKIPGQIPWIGAGQASTSTSVSINFAPPNDGGVPLTYVIMYRVSGAGGWTKFGNVGWTGWQTVAPLSPATSYDFEVYASNGAGSGLPSSVYTVSTLSQ